MTTIATKERSLIMTGESVRAVLAGRKTQTRRVARDQTAKSYQWVSQFPVIPTRDGLYEGWAKDCGQSFLLPTSCPYGSVGERLWVRESFSHSREWHMNPWYWADGDPTDGDYEKPKPSIHMPRWASRLTLEITDVRVERVQDVSENDVLAEGVTVDKVAAVAGVPWSEMPDLYTAFRVLWDALNAKRGYSWNDNPFVWVLSFRRV